MKEATQDPGRHTRQGAVSIHAPVKEATHELHNADRTGFGFNPRSREGSDPRMVLPKTSIMGFNPRSREGSDAHGVILAVTRGEFQSTLP